MTTRAYRRLLIGTVLATFALIVVSGAARISGTTCSDWLLCTGQGLPLAEGVVVVQRLLVLINTGLLLAAALVAWFRRGDDRWVRYPVLLAPIFFLIQALVSSVLARYMLPGLAMIADLGLATITMGCVVIATVSLSIPDERNSERLGGRAARQARHYRWLALGMVLVVWFMVLTGSALTANSDLLALEATLQLAHRITVMLVGILLGWLFWLTWRTRQHDQALLGVATFALGLLATQALLGAASLSLDLPELLRGLHLALATELWGAAVAFGVLALRRPAPALVELTPPLRQHAAAKGGLAALINDYISLTKPKVISLLLVTTLAAMFITDRGMPTLALVFWTMLGGYLAAGGAGAINCAFDSDIDINMGRTSRRPVPSGRIQAFQAFWFGIGLCVLAFLVLAVFTTLLAAVLAMVGAVYYTLIYTRWLKRSTWQNIVIGGGAGAIPPLVGWTAVTGELSLAAILLFVIIFYWTPPHFWALALVKQKDYARAGVPMLPVVAGEAETRWQIMLYSLLMVALSLLLTPLQAMGLVYLVLALVLGAVFLRYAWQVWRDGGQAHIWGLYKYSLLYLALLFVAMVADRLLLT